MPVIKFSVSEEHYHQLEELAKEQGVTIQDIVRKRVFNEDTIYTPAEAVRRALENYTKGDRFTIPDLFPTWNLKRGAAGIFGRQCFNYIKEEYKDKIVYVGTNKQKRQAEYEII